MANADEGRIKTMCDWAKELGQEEMTALIPFEVDEKIEIKGCLFRVRLIHPHPNNIITLEMLPKAEDPK